MTKETQAIYQQIKNEIITLKKEPGSLLKEMDIARKYNISRTPVREILNRLEWDKLIESQRSSGTYVTKIDIDQISDIMYVRVQLEIGVLNEIMEVITPGDIVKYKMIISDQQEILNNSAIGREEMVNKFVELDMLFIKMFYLKVAKESIFLELSNVQLCYARYLFLIFTSYSNTMIETCRYSELLVDALSKHDRKKVAEICSNQKYIGLEKIRMIKIAHPNYFI